MLTSTDVRVTVGASAPSLAATAETVPATDPTEVLEGLNRQAARVAVFDLAHLVMVEHYGLIVSGAAPL